jgi:phosphohistidine swiveling domain-containing protein
MNSNKNVEILNNIELEDGAIIGKSILTLAKFAQEKLPISNGFVITTLGFNSFLDFTELRKYYQNSSRIHNSDFKDIASAFDVIEFPTHLAGEITKSYSKISGFTNAFVNLRALILDKDGNEISHRSFVILDIRDEEVILRNVKELYKQVIFDNTKILEKFFEAELQIVVLAQKALQSEASGIVFTTDIVTKDKNKLVIEAIYGLESIIDSTPLIPDQYIYNKDTKNIDEKHISIQEYMAVRQVTIGSSKIEKVKISPNWQRRQKIDDKHILTLAKTGEIIEEGIGKPQQIIWSFEGGKIWINFIEGSEKLKLKNKEEPTLQELVDETIIASEILPAHTNDGLDIKVHIPEEVSNNKDILMDIVLKEPEQSLSEPHIEELNVSNNNLNLSDLSNMPMESNILKNNVNTVLEEPLIQGRYFAGGEAQGDVSLDISKAKSTNIIVLNGNEDLPTSIKVAGFIIEDESELLASRLSEYFGVPVITGVPLARKILKADEKIRIDGSTGNIYETVPFSEQVGEIEMNFVSTSNANTTESNFSIPLNKEETTVVHTEITPSQDTDDNSPEVLVSEETKVEIELGDELEGRDADNAKNESEEEISKLLELVDYDNEIASVEETNFVQDEVSGMEPKDQFQSWGKSLENILSASKTVTTPIAATVLEEVIDDNTQLNQISKEASFDADEDFIASNLHIEEEGKKFKSEFIPTATKVFVHLIDEKLPKEFKNFDGIIFSSSYDMDVYLEILEDVLEKADGKEVLAICPPYETEALKAFLESIHTLRNTHRNVSLILPDYRNKSEIADIKKMLSSIGLRRSSTFLTLANISRSINIFRIAELDNTLVDGMYIDLFRIKMNMLGVEKLKASTRYAQGLENLVSYLDENMPFEGKAIVDITGFINSNIIKHISQFKFTAFGCSLANADKVKKLISQTEKKHISNLVPYKKVRLRKKS